MRANDIEHLKEIGKGREIGCGGRGRGTGKDRKEDEMVMTDRLESLFICL